MFLWLTVHDYRTSKSMWSGHSRCVWWHIYVSGIIFSVSQFSHTHSLTAHRTTNKPIHTRCLFSLLSCHSLWTPCAVPVLWPTVLIVRLVPSANNFRIVIHVSFLQCAFFFPVVAGFWFLYMYMYLKWDPCSLTASFDLFSLQATAMITQVDLNRCAQRPATHTTPCAAASTAKLQQNKIASAAKPGSVRRGNFAPPLPIHVNTLSAATRTVRKF